MTRRKKMKSRRRRNSVLKDCLFDSLVIQKVCVLFDCLICDLRVRISQATHTKKAADVTILNKGMQ